jgi:hypothetical protein
MDIQQEQSVLQEHLADDGDGARSCGAETTEMSIGLFLSLRMHTPTTVADNVSSCQGSFLADTGGANLDIPVVKRWGAVPSCSPIAARNSLPPAPGAT